MRLNPCPLIILLAFMAFSAPVSAQGEPDPFRVHLRSGAFTPSADISSNTLNSFNRNTSRSAGRGMALMQFTQMPGKAERQLLLQNGITLLDYIPNNAFVISYTGDLRPELLQQLKVRSIAALSPQQKMDPQFAAGIIPSRAVTIAGTVDVQISFPYVFNAAEVEASLKALNFDILPSMFRDYRILSVRLSSARIAELAALPYVEYVQPAQGPDQLLNNKSTVNARSNVLRSNLPGGRNLTGNGVVIGIGDDSNPLNHIDYAERAINRNPVPFGQHGLHVMGTASGAGIVEEKYTGFAPKSTILSQNMSNLLAYTSAYVADHNMVVSNNSYGSVTNDCLNFGYYQLSSRILDQQVTAFPALSVVFAAGNSGLINCNRGYPASFATVLSDYQSAKNVIDVGAATENDSIAPSSSRGPVNDGRIKPELVAQGRKVVSGWSNHIYSFNSGTSMAAPAVSGGLALLYERYRQLNAGADPKNAFIKALLLNGATDVGNPGPDYTYGFGWMNLLRSVQMMENGQWFTGTVAPAATNTHSITLPASPAGRQLKVMLYWNDSAASVLAAHTLVNDLDLEVVTPAASTILPMILDTTRANVNSFAVPGADHINNIEQVLINTPVTGGTYTVRVKGTTIPSAVAQEYFVAWDLIPDSTKLTYPIGGERIKSGDSLYISWDAWGAPGNTFKVEYSLNNGGSWTLIQNNIPDSVRQWKWFAPAGPTENALIRLTNNNTGMVSTSQAFIIIGVPVISLSAVQCEGYISVDWTAVASATDYEVMMDRNGEMVSMGTTNALTYAISGLSKDSIYWVSVRARLNGVPGPRAFATSRQPNSGTCAGTISDNDVKLDSLVSPATGGRKLTSTAFGTAQPITIRIKNLDDATTTGNLQARYVINAGTPVVETITAPNIAAGATFDYTFTATADLSATGTYAITASVTRAGDPVAGNDTLRRTVKQLDNPAISLATPFLDDMETASVQEWNYRVTGLNGLDRYDFVNSTSNGRIRSFINSGLAYSGSKALTLDALTYTSAGNTDSLTGTFNLSGYTTSDDIRLDFRYKNHAQAANAANKVWVRGDDTQPWIQVYDLYTNQNAADGSYKLTESIELTDSLLAYTQNFSSSFQVRWGQWGKYLTADNDGGAGYSFDDIRLYKVTNDLQMMSIDTPVSNSCNLSAATPVKATVRNTANSAVAGAQIVLKVDGTVIATENLPVIPANTTGQYTFAATANLAAAGAHTVVVYTKLVTDTYAANDTVQVSLVNSALINVTSASEYLQNFELSSGGWYTTGGKNSTWQYGTPASTKINRAASGSKAWKTSSVGNYNDAEQSYLYSPCFDISTLANPTLSLSIALDLEDCGSGLCDGAWVEYSADGITWTRLGAYNQAGSTNWYNKNYASNNLWSIQDYTRWHAATVKLPAGISTLRLRVVMASDISVNKEGVGIDDIHIYDNPYGIYVGPTNTGVITQATVSGSNWVDFIDGGTNKLVASVNPNGGNLGSTDVRAYFNTGAVRYNLTQYYHDRNITIIPTNLTLADSATVRYYFTDAETETLINATNCGFCYKPASVFDLGVSKYSDPVKSNENGTIDDNTGGIWNFYKPDSVLKVPFDKGYYAEFKVNNFSEFWLNNGGLSRAKPLPVELTDFTVTRQNNDAVLINWTIATELNVDHYDIEVAKGSGAYQLNQFVRIGRVASLGNTNQSRRYNFTDAESGKNGVRYYRLKTVDRDGHISYSVIRSLIFDTDISWQVYPNPSTGIFELQLQVPDADPVSIRISDVTGKTLRDWKTSGTGFAQKITVDLSAPRYPSGIYMLELNTPAKKQFFKLIKR